MQLLLCAVATVGLILAAAKAHGRQIRIEREQQGVFAVDFRHKNPAPVEAIWRVDRRLFWPTFAVMAAAGLLETLVLRDYVRAAFALPWAFALAFIVAGIASWVRMGRLDKGPLPWRRRAIQGSLAWWGLVLVVAALVAWTL